MGCILLSLLLLCFKIEQKAFDGTYFVVVDGFKLEREVFSDVCSFQDEHHMVLTMQVWSV